MSTVDRDHPSFTDKYISDGMLEAFANLLLALVVSYLVGVNIMIWYFIIHPTSFDSIVTFDLLWKVQNALTIFYIAGVLNALYKGVILREPGEGGMHYRGG